MLELTATALFLAFGRRLFAVDRRAAGALLTLDAAEGDVIAAVSAVGGQPSPAAAVVTQGKQLMVAAIPDAGATAAGATLRVLDTATVARRCTTIASAVIPGTSPAHHVVLVGDKVGDVTAYAVPAVSTRRRVLLGHTGSYVTALAVSLDGRYVYSGDREEKVRVSHFPATHILQAVCAGHTRFVACLTNLHDALSPGTGTDLITPGSAARRAAVAAAVASVMTPSAATSTHVPASMDAVTDHVRHYASGDLLLTGGGDGTLRLWHAVTGTMLHTVYLHRASPGAEAAPTSTTAATPATGLSFEHGPVWCVSSAGAHADGDMVEREGDEEGEEEEGGGPPSAAGDVGEGADDTAVVGTEAGVGSKLTAPGGGSGGPGLAPIIPRAFGAEPMKAQGSTGIIPSRVVQCARTGLIATFVEGEAVVRLFRVYMDTDPDCLASAHSTATHVTRLAQARLTNVGIIKLGGCTRVYDIAFDPAPHPAKAGHDGATTLVIMVVAPASPEEVCLHLRPVLIHGAKLGGVPAHVVPATAVVGLDVPSLAAQLAAGTVAPAAMAAQWCTNEAYTNLATYDKAAMKMHGRYTVGGADTTGDATEGQGAKGESH